jgi:hypothetical protein
VSELLQTEVEFELPKGYVDGEGTLHRAGVMRLATAADEIKPLTDPRVKANPSYLSVVLLSRVVTRLGDLEEVTPHVVENLFVTDLAYLQELYTRVNEYGADVAEAVCPECGESFEAPVTRRDGSVGPEPADDGEVTATEYGDPEVMPGNPEPGGADAPDAPDAADAVDSAKAAESTARSDSPSPATAPGRLTVGEPLRRGPDPDRDPAPESDAE